MPRTTPGGTCRTRSIGPVSGWVQPMRVLLIPNDFPTEQEPYRTYFNYLAARELANLVDLRVLWLRAWLPGRKLVQTANINGMPVITATGPIWPDREKLNLLFYHRFVWPFVSKYFQGIDLIHSVGVDFAGIIAGLWARKTRVHHVTQFISDPSALKADFYALPYARQLRQHVQGVACNSKALEQCARNLFPDLANIHAVYRGVDVSRFSPEGPTAGPLQDCPPTRFLFLGGLPSYPEREFDYNTKGGVTLMAAWRQAEDELAARGAHLLFAGPAANNRMAQQWREGLKYPGRVFLSGEIKPETVPAYIRAADVVLIPSMAEGLPNLALEAGACARPVFASDIACNAEIVVPNDTGRLIPAGDVSAWQSVLMTYADAARRPELREMGLRARKRMTTGFDYRNYAPQMVQMYRQAMAYPLSQ